MHTLGTGCFGAWKDIVICNDACKNLVSGGTLRQMGYGLLLTRVPTIASLSDNEIVIVGSFLESGLPYCSLMDVLHLPDMTSETEDQQPEEVHLSDRTDDDPLDLLHQGCGHVSKDKLLTAYKVWFLFFSSFFIK